jgi:hypothetical protein
MAFLHATVWTDMVAGSSGSLNHSYLLHLNQNHDSSMSISHDRSEWGENGYVTTTTHSSILSVPVTCYSSGDTPPHTFSSSYMLIFWRHTAAYFQFQLHANLLATRRCILSVPVKRQSYGMYVMKSGRNCPTYGGTSATTCIPQFLPDYTV